MSRHRKRRRPRRATEPATAKKPEPVPNKPKLRVGKGKLAAAAVAAAAIAIGVGGHSRQSHPVPLRGMKPAAKSQLAEKRPVFSHVRFPKGLSKYERAILGLWVNNAGFILQGLDPGFVSKISGKNIKLIFGDVKELKKKLPQIQPNWVGDAMTIMIATRNGIEHRVIIDWNSIQRRGDMRHVIPILIHELGGHLTHADKVFSQIKREGFSDRLWAEDEVRAFTYSNGILERFLRDASSPEMKGTAFERLKPIFEEALYMDRLRLKKWKADLAAAQAK